MPGGVPLDELFWLGIQWLLIVTGMCIAALAFVVLITREQNDEFDDGQDEPGENVGHEPRQSWSAKHSEHMSSKHHSQSRPTESPENPQSPQK